MKVIVESILKKRIEDGFEFNVLIVGEIFKSTRNHLLFGCVDGRIIVYQGNCLNNNGNSNSNIEEVLESKGTSIQSLHLADTTKFGGVDIVSGDSHGNLVVFSNHQIIYHSHSNGGAISSLTTHQTINGDFSIIVGDRGGVITSLKPHQPVQWNLKLPNVVEQQRLGFQREANDDADNDDDDDDNGEDKDKDDKDKKNNDIDHLNNNSNLNNNRQTLQASQCVRDIISHRSLDIYNVESSYLVVADNFSRVHFIDRGHFIYTLNTPSSINTMCSGYFDKSIAGKSQLALGCENGFIYLVGKDLKLYKYCNVGYPITHIYRYRMSNSTTVSSGNNNKENSNGNHGENTNGSTNQEDHIDNEKQESDSNESVDQLDCLLVIGHFHSLKIYLNKEMIGEHMTDDWIHTLSVGDILNNGDNSVIVIGKLNNSIEYLKPTIIPNKPKEKHLNGTINK